MSQANTIAVTVGAGTESAGATPTYTHQQTNGNRSTYIDTTVHTSASRQQLQLYRTFAKRSNASLGTVKVAVKLTKDVSVPNADGSGNLVLPMIFNAEIAVPAGVTSEDAEYLREEMRGILANYTVMHALVEDQMI